MAISPDVQIWEILAGTVRTVSCYKSQRSMDRWIESIESSSDVDIGISAVCYRTGEAEKKTILRNTISDEILYEKV